MRTKKNDIHIISRKENRNHEQGLNVQRLSTNSNSPGSPPKRYQSVFGQGTPLTSFGLNNDDNYSRTYSPPNHIEPQTHQRSVKPVREFLTIHPLVKQQLDDRHRPSSHTNNAFTRSQTEATVQNVNTALTRTFDQLRPESSHTASARTPAIHVQPTSARVITHQNTGTTTTSSNYYYQSAVDTKRSLPSELIAKRPTSSLASTILPNSISHNRVPTGASSLVVQRATATTINDIKTNEYSSIRPPTPLRISSKHHDVASDPFEKFSYDHVVRDEQSKRSRTGKNDLNPQKGKSRKQSPVPQIPNIDKQHRTLPEVSVHPQIQSTVQHNTNQSSYPHAPIVHGETYTNHHHHIQVEPSSELKRISSSIKSPQIIDVQPNITVQHPQSNSLNEAYVEQDHPHARGLTVENAQTSDNDDDDDDSTTSTLKQYESQLMNNPPMLSAPPPSPSSRDLSHTWTRQRNKNSVRTGTGALVNRKNTKHQRPSCRLKRDGDDSDSELTLTETQSREDDLAHRHDPLPSDMISDGWSDLTSEFSDSKLRKNPNIRTSTPNITQQSSSMSSKELGQMRRQLKRLQMMYDDLLKIFDYDIESMRGSIKSTTSSPTEHHERKHRFRKVAPVTSKHQSNSDMKEINQRFTRIESSIVTLAESIAKLSAQVQVQRTVKDDVTRLREEMAELHQQFARQQSAVPTGGQTSHLITPNVQRLAVSQSTSPINITTSFLPPTSTNQRSNSIIDPRQARKIEQFFGTEALLRYFLSLLNYEEYIPVFEQERIGFCELAFLNERKLQSLGIPHGPCMRIIYEAQQYFTSSLALKSHGIYV